MKFRIDGRELESIENIRIGEACEAEKALGLDMEAGFTARIAVMLFVSMRRADPNKPAHLLADEVMRADLSTLEEVEGQLQVYQSDLARDFEYRMADIDKILLEMERRGHHFFDDTMRIGRVMDLLNRSRMQEAFERVQTLMHFRHWWRHERRIVQSAPRRSDPVLSSSEFARSGLVTPDSLHEDGV